MRLVTSLILALSLSLAQAADLPKQPAQQTAKKASSKKSAPKKNKIIRKKSNVGSVNKIEPSKAVK